MTALILIKTVRFLLIDLKIHENSIIKPPYGIQIGKVLTEPCLLYKGTKRCSLSDENTYIETQCHSRPGKVLNSYALERYRRKKYFRAGHGTIYNQSTSMK